MSKRQTLQSFKKTQARFILLPFLALFAAGSPFLAAQEVSEQSTIVSPAADDALSALPDAPSPASSSSSQQAPSDPLASSNSTSSRLKSPLIDLLNSHRKMVVLPNEKVQQPLAANQKVTLGMQEPFSLFAVTGWVTSAGWSHVRNSSPNYGTDSGAYGERLGATALRNLSENIIGNAVLSPILHEDPRYFVMGSGHNVFRRTAYAVSRVFVTRDDGGRNTLNYALLGGNLGGAALTNAYYPSANRSFTQTAETFGTSLAGSAIGFFIDEFYVDALQLVHLKKGE